MALVMGVRVCVLVYLLQLQLETVEVMKRGMFDSLSSSYSERCQAFRASSLYFRPVWGR